MPELDSLREYYMPHVVRTWMHGIHVTMCSTQLYLTASCMVLCRGRNEASGRTYDVFISHAGPQKANFAVWLQRELQRHGVSAFLDERSLRLGDAAGPEMEAAVRSCSIVVIVLTPDFVRSSYCMRELHWALHPSQLHPVQLQQVATQPRCSQQQAAHVGRMRSRTGPHSSAASGQACYQCSTTPVISMRFSWMWSSRLQRPARVADHQQSYSSCSRSAMTWARFAGSPVTGWTRITSASQLALEWLQFGM